MTTKRARGAYFSLDFESAGGVPSRHAFTQFGCTMHDDDTGDVLEEFSMYANMKGYTWEKRCVDEFWMKFPERLQETIAGTAAAPHSPHGVIAIFGDWVKQSMEKHVVKAKDNEPNNVYFIGDNVAYDYGLLKYFADFDIMYITGRYTDFIDVSNVYYGMYSYKHRKSITAPFLDSISSKKCALDVAGLTAFREMGVAHDHHPVNDAKNIGYKWFEIKTAMGKKVGSA